MVLSSEALVVFLLIFSALFLLRHGLPLLFIHSLNVSSFRYFFATIVAEMRLITKAIMSVSRRFICWSYYSSFYGLILYAFAPKSEKEASGQMTSGFRFFPPVMCQHKLHTVIYFLADSLQKSWKTGNSDAPALLILA